MRLRPRFTPNAFVPHCHLPFSSVWRRFPSIPIVIPCSVWDLRAIARTCLALVIALVTATFLMSASAVFAGSPTPPQSCPNTIDYIDPTYGQRIRQLWKSDGHEHNIYFHRNPWNANNSYMIGIESNLEQKNWRVVLYDGAGCFIKDLFAPEQYDWRLVWDRHDPKILYTWHGSRLYRYDVTTATAQLLKSFSSSNLTLKPNGPSLNQAGDRLLVITSDDTFRSYRIADMQEERSFKVTFPPNCVSDFGKDTRYIGYNNYIATGCQSSDGSISALVIYDDTGALMHRFDGMAMGHKDFSPNGQLAYYTMGGGKPLNIHVVNLDGTNDRILYSVPPSQAKYVRSLHLSWPDRVNNWFIASFFPLSETSTTPYAPPRDEIAMIRLDGAVKYLARTGSWPGDFFWSQPLASPSGDGTRISFNSNCASDVPMLGCTESGTGDHYVLFTKTPSSSRGADSSPTGSTAGR